MRAISTGLRLTCAAVLIASGLAMIGQPRRVSVTATCLQGCRPSPSSFQVPPGVLAKGFAIRSLTAGRACSGSSEQVKGFSIRRGDQTVLVFYLGPAGPVSDPLPIEDLELAAGAYQLYAAPASGASVTLTYSLVTQ